MALLLGSGAALAQPSEPDARDTAAARALFLQGLDLADQGEWADAADRFGRAARLRRTARIDYNLGLVLVRLNRLVEASEAFRRVVRDDSATERVRLRATARLERVVPRLASLTIRIPGGAAGVEVRLDDRALSSAVIGSPTPVDPGDHTVSAARDGADAVTETISVEEGASVEVSLEPPLSVPAPLEVALQADRDGVVDELGENAGASTSEVHEQWWFWTTIVGVLVVAAVTTSLALAFSGPSDNGPMMLDCGALDLGCVTVP